MMEARADAWPRLTAAKATVEAAKGAATAAVAAVPQQPFGAAAGAGQVPPLIPPFMGGGAGGMPGLGAGGFPQSAEMQSAMSNLLSDPGALQAMMRVRTMFSCVCRVMCNQYLTNLSIFPLSLLSLFQNPMVQQMMRSDPRMANNPMMQQAIEEVRSDFAPVGEILYNM